MDIALVLALTMSSTPYSASMRVKGQQQLRKTMYLTTPEGGIRLAHHAI